MSGPRLWIVDRPGSRVFLFGVAVGVPDGGWVGDELRAAVGSSRELWQEADRATVSASPRLAHYALAPEPLARRLDERRLARVHEVARGVGIDPATLADVRPWVVGQLLDGAMRSQAGFDAAHAVDEVVAGLAAAAGLPVRYELGDAEATLSWFDGLAPDVEVDYLMWTTERVAAGPDPVARHAAAWAQGDLSVAEAEERALRRDHPALHHRLLVERNRAWVPRIEAMLSEPGDAFVLVGDLHLVGEDSIPACLTAAGLVPVQSPPRRYRSPDEDSARWWGVALRPGDIVVSTRSKHGTTWVQAICALLVHGTPDLPAPLAELSPWLDWRGEPRDAVVARLDAQPGRRVIKTHTPLDGLPLDPRAHYVVVARHPLDGAVSLYHQGANLDRTRIRELTGAPPPPERPPLAEWLARWIAADPDPAEALDSLPGVLHHLADAWARRDQPHVTLVHYADLLADRDREMRRLAARLGLDAVDPGAWPALVEAAGFASMRAAADRLAPDPGGILRDRAAFFRRGGSGAGAEALPAAQVARYEARAAELAPPDLLAWLHR
jgi:uncharacterized protein YbaP (TraB family)